MCPLPMSDIWRSDPYVMRHLQMARASGALGRPDSSMFQLIMGQLLEGHERQQEEKRTTWELEYQMMLQRPEMYKGMMEQREADKKAKQLGPEDLDWDNMTIEEIEAAVDWRAPSTREEAEALSEMMEQAAEQYGVELPDYVTDDWVGLGPDDIEQMSD